MNTAKDFTLTLYKDDAVAADLFSTQAEQAAQQVQPDRAGQNTLTQLRRFYEDVLSLWEEYRNCKNTRGEEIAAAQWRTTFQPRVGLFVARAAYARSRNLVTEQMVTLMRQAQQQIKEPQHLQLFVWFFEALIGFTKYHEEKQRALQRSNRGKR